MDAFYHQLQDLLQKRVTLGWQNFLASDHYHDFEEFAVYLETLPEFQEKFRPKVPHPPHAAAARLMGFPFMHQIMRLGIDTLSWWPGEFYASKETESIDEQGSEWHARIFELDLLYDRGSKKLCRMRFTCAHSHHGFSFKEPKAEIIQIYQNDVEKVFPELVDLVMKCDV